ncbi:MAG: CPBP family intramembrane metalloprotease [Anaerolineales bacterium]|nr:CPBP family intramembrane metalloprotease [Anaerolineales bacterium]
MSVNTSSTENRIISFIKQNPLISIYIIMFTIAWSVMIPQALYAQGIISVQLPGILEIFIGWSPAIAALIVYGVLAGRTGIREIFGRFLIWRVGFRWYFIGIFLLAVIILGGIGLHVLFGGARPVIPAAGKPLWEVAVTVLVFLLLLSLFNTEEIVWRGIAIPRLRDRFGMLVTVLLIAIPEVILHLPLFWDTSIPFYQTVGIYWFSAFSIAMVVIYVYVFNMTKGSLIIVTLLHASQNAWSTLLSDNSARPFHFTVALAWVIALILIVATRSHLGHQRDKE